MAMNLVGGDVVDIELKFLRLCEKLRILKVAVKVSRRVSRRSLGTPGGATKGRWNSYCPPCLIGRKTILIRPGLDDFRYNRQVFSRESSHFR
jgi:hypothetical protein